MKSKSDKNLHTRIAAWSDAHLEAARAFVKTYGELIPRDLTSAQLYGLANITCSAREFKQLNTFMDNQASKAERANNEKVHDCWRALKAKFAAFHPDAQEISRDAGPGRTVDEIHLLLAQRFAQHLIAESLVYQKTTKYEGRERKADPQPKKYAN
ncbi:MAG: hypothetical protein HUU32_16925 [Calditrichaceae bacterium]|nr:hypothetical protein [Calditrichia bacterium]NUQ43075.1 hypothetical protein [Calditrichaceae bacterium]